MQRLNLHAPAKINLTLDVLGRRPDGYHELATTMHQIDWVDTVSLEKIPGPTVLDHDHADLPKGAENLAFQAAEAVKKYTDLKQNVRIMIHKRIPVEAGLAGGSTNAAAVIRGMNTLFELSLTEMEMCAIGETLGSDVPFCICGGTAFCTGRGEIMQALPSDQVGLVFVLVKPNFSLSTGQVFSRFSTDIVHSRPQEKTFQTAWRQAKVKEMLPAMVNVLERVSIQLKPEIATIKQELYDGGALHAMMSGSGPTVFGIFTDRRQAVQTADALKLRYPAVRLCRSFYNDT